MNVVSTAARVRFPLRVKLALFAIGLLILHIAAVGMAAIELTRATIETSQRELEIAIIESVAREIEQDFGDARVDLERIASALANQHLSKDARIEVAAAVIESSRVLPNAAVYDRDGKLITSVHAPQDAEVSAADRLDPQLRAMAENAAFGSTAGIAQPEPSIPMAVPIVSATGDTTGFVAGSMPASLLQAEVERLADAHFTDLPRPLFVLDQELRYLAHPDRELSDTLQSAAHEGIVEGLERYEPGTAFSRSGEFTGADGIERVGTVVALPEQGWLVAAQVPQSVAYAPIRRMQWIVACAATVAIVLAAIASIVLAQRITSPLRALSDFAGEIANRKFDRRVDIKTSDELSLVGDAMSRAAEDLQASEVRIREEVAIRSDLGRYLPAELVDKVVKREQDMGLGGTRKDITVMFADVVAFTPLTQELDPETVVHLLNELFTIITEIIFRHHGTVDKFVGDSVMAIWGAPETRDDHAALALEAAEEIISWLDASNDDWERRYGTRIQIAIGINSGKAVVGNIGSKSRMEYTAIGDTVNLAARLEAIARPQQILTTSNTAQRVGPGFHLVEAGERKVAGMSDPVTLFELRP